MRPELKHFLKVFGASFFMGFGAFAGGSTFVYFYEKFTGEHIDAN